MSRNPARDPFVDELADNLVSAVEQAETGPTLPDWSPALGYFGSPPLWVLERLSVALRARDSLSWCDDVWANPDADLVILLARLHDVRCPPCSAESFFVGTCDRCWSATPFARVLYWADPLMVEAVLCHACAMPDGGAAE